MRVLIVGSGNVGEEKLSALLRNSPETQVRVVASLIRDITRKLAEKAAHVELVERKFEEPDLDLADIVILATDQPELHVEIRKQAKARRLLVNVADTPHLCDFYLGSIVQKGSLKIAISTNGRSPTFAKRVRQLLESSLPDTEDLDQLLDHLHEFRNRLKGISGRK